MKLAYYIYISSSESHKNSKTIFWTMGQMGQISHTNIGEGPYNIQKIVQVCGFTSPDKTTIIYPTTV